MGEESPTTDPRMTEAVDSHFARVKPFFDVALVDVAEVTAQA